MGDFFTASHSREGNLALSVLSAVAHARRLTGTRKSRKCAQRLGVRRLDAAVAPRGGSAVLNRAVAAPKSQGGVKPPHSKVPSAQAFSEQSKIPRPAACLRERFGRQAQSLRACAHRRAPARLPSR